MAERAVKIGSVNDRHGMPVSIAITRGQNITMVGVCGVLPFSRAAARRLISLLEEAVQTLNGDGKNG